MARDAVTNTLYYGDNLEVLRRHIPDECVDLIYLDPPFNSNADYNVLFAEHAEKSHAQIVAFGDTWTWDTEAARNFADAVQNGGDHVAGCMRAFQTLLGTNDMLAYLAMMAPRLVELRRVLKPTGSIFIHCDDTTSHYLKLLMDAVFRPQNYRNEIVWERTTGRKGVSRFGRVHDIILFYAKSEKLTWNAPTTPQTEENIQGHDIMEDDGGLYRVSDFSGAGHGPPRHFGKIEIAPPPGRHWQFDQKGVDRLMNEGRIAFSKGGKPRLKTYVKDLSGKAVRDIWTDIEPINAAAAERLGYPTQKPQLLLERIVNAASNPGDVVLDPFCGCGTTIAAALKLDRRWLGIDITHLAINLIKVRLADAFGDNIANTYKVIGEPTDLDGAKALAAQDKYQFQYWALGLVRARPIEEKKGADKGIDGRRYLADARGITQTVVISVKGGHVTVSQIRDLRGVVQRENAAIGVFICLEEPTAPMRAEAASAGFYDAQNLGNTKHPRLQILTIADLLNGKKIDLPLQQDLPSFKQAPKVKKTGPKTATLNFGEAEAGAPIKK